MAGVWAVDGARVPASSARSVLFQATNGATGVVRPGDLKVKASETPDNRVRMLPGSAVMENRYLSDGGGQSYGTTMMEQEYLNIPATGSGGGATRYVIQRITDPEFSGQIPADPLTARYDSFELVSAVTSGGKPHLPYPYVPLARIIQPANTATITDAMITDWREVANPRHKTFQMPRPTISTDTGLTLVSRSAYPDGEWFPNVGGQQNTGAYYIDVPTWATKMILRMEWLSVRYSGNPGYGWFWMTYGPDAGSPTPTRYTQAFAWDSDEASSRANWITEQEVSIPAAWRGTTIPVVPRANKTAPTTYTGDVQLAATSGMLFKAEFKETADPDA